MIYNKEINGVKFTLVCEYWQTKTAWGHKVSLYRNESFFVGSARIRYYNRTWEKYQYQSIIKSVIFNAMQEIKAAAKKMFLSVHNYKVMTKKRSAAFLEYLDEEHEYNTYNELLKMF